MSSRLTIKSTDSNAKNINEYFYTNITTAEIVDTSTGKADLINTFGRNIIGLTTNSFNDVVLVETTSTEEILAE